MPPVRNPHTVITAMDAMASSPATFANIQQALQRTADGSTLTSARVRDLICQLCNQDYALRTVSHAGSRSPQRYTLSAVGRTHLADLRRRQSMPAPAPPEGPLVPPRTITSADHLSAADALWLQPPARPGALDFMRCPSLVGGSLQPYRHAQLHHTHHDKSAQQPQQPQQPQQQPAPAQHQRHRQRADRAVQNARTVCA